MKVTGSQAKDKHPYVLLELPYSDVGGDALLESRTESIEIDERIVPLIRLLWSRGIETLCSCQGDPDKKITKGKLAGGTARHGGYVGFPDRSAFRRFMGLVTYDFAGLTENGVFEIYFHDMARHHHEGVTMRFDHPRLDDLIAFVRRHADPLVAVT